jgi:hypothetical protein
LNDSDNQLNKNIIENNNISLLEKNFSEKNLRSANNNDVFKNMENTNAQKNINYGNLQDLVRGKFF